MKYFCLKNFTTKGGVESSLSTGVGNLRPAGRMRPAKAFYPARDLISFFNDRYAAINRQNDSHLVAKTFFVVFATDSSEKGPEFSAKTFFLFIFWSTLSIRPKKGLNF